MSPALKRVLSFVIALGASLALIGSSPASAGPVTVEYTCVTIGHITYPATFHITITAPATINRGQTATLRVAFDRENPLSSTSPAGSQDAYMDINYRGASSGRIRAEGLKNRSGDGIRYEGGVAQVVLSNAGTVTFRPSTISLLRSAVCSVRGGDDDAPVAAGIRVL